MNNPGDNNKKQKNQLIAIIILSVTTAIFAIASIVLYFQYDDKASQLEYLSSNTESKDSLLKSKTEELEELGAELERIREEREQLGLRNDSLDAQIAQLNTYVSEIKSTKRVDVRKLRELEKMIAKLREEVTAKDQEIVTLKTQNDSLSTNLTTVSEEKTRLGDSLNVKLKELEYASILHADEIKVTALKDNGKELDKEEYKSKQIDRIKISFRLADNKAAKKNNKTFYVRLVTPAGTAFSDPANGGGVLQTVDGKEVLYTFTESIMFDNTRQQLAVTMPKGFNYEPGDYKVEVYAEGFKIGDGGFKVKESKLF